MPPSQRCRHVRHAATLGFFLDRLARRTLGADEQDGAALLRQALMKFIASLNSGTVFSRLMMWILPRAPKMYGAILGFQ
jgi:hypothetical protein